VIGLAKTFRSKIVLATRRVRYPAKNEHGSAILETALSLMVFLSFLFGVMQAGLALYSYNYIAEAAREGARYAIVRGATWGTPCASYTSSDCTATPAHVQSYVQNLAFPGINPSYLTVSTPVYTAYASGSACPGSGPCNSAGNQVAITVTYNFPLNVPFIPLHTASMSSTAAMIIAQ
jgi:Flp pilus assembly protein TadG